VNAERARAGLPVEREPPAFSPDVEAIEPLDADDNGGHDAAAAFGVAAAVGDHPALDGFQFANLMLPEALVPYLRPVERAATTNPALAWFGDLPVLVSCLWVIGHQSTPTPLVALRCKW
jgi:hypothetical protein